MSPIPSEGAKQAELVPVLKGSEYRQVPVRMLFIHSVAVDVEDCIREINRTDFKLTADVVQTFEQFGERLRSSPYDVVVAEYPVPIRDGMRTILELLEQMGKHTPCIFVTKNAPLETVAELITKGATDCIEMDHIGHLPVAIRRALDENNVREQRDRAEKNLRHSEAHYRALVGNLVYGMCRCDMEGKFLDANDTLVTMLGYSSKEELLAVNLAGEMVCDPGKRAQLLGHSGEDEQADPLEVQWKRKDGTTLNVRISGREVSSGEGEMHSYEIIAEDVTKQRELEDHLRQQAAKDSLTGLANYRSLVDVLDLEIKRSKRTGREFALLLFDLDGLKQINDRYGHLTGSQALCRFADVLSVNCRDIDTAARFGGDEFALVLPETQGEPASLVAERVRGRIANDGREPKLSVSVGVALYPRDGEKIDDLLGIADQAMYSMKARTRTIAAGSSGGSELRHKTTAIGRQTGPGHLSS